MPLPDLLWPLPHGPLPLPAFLPDATRGVVRAVDSADLERCGVSAVVMNIFHLMQHPGSSTIRALGGLHRMCGWPHVIMTDSGGFQVYSLIRQNPRSGSLSDRGITFRPGGSGRKFHLTPEKSIQLQFRYGADLLVCLDDCTHVEQPREVQEEAVERTLHWARRSRAEFQRLVERQGLSPEQRPRLMAVIQGGGSLELRRRCAEALLEMGFEAFGYGGWPLDRQGHLLADLLAYTRQLVPSDYPMQALGVGHPANVVACVRMGYTLFDSSLPTRDARQGRLYVFNADPFSAARPGEGEWFSYLYIRDSKHLKADDPLSPFCDGECCARYSRGYLHHLFKIHDSLALRLATMHNLRFMMQLMERLRREAHERPGA